MPDDVTRPKLPNIDARHLAVLRSYQDNGYTSKGDAMEANGYSRQNPSFIFSRPEVRIELEAMKAQDRARAELTADWVQSRLMLLADANTGELAEIVSRHGIEALTDDQKYQLGSVKEVVKLVGRGDNKEEVRETTLTVESRTAALTQLGKAQGMFTEKVEVSGAVSIAQTLMEGRKKLAEEARKRKADGDWTA